MRLLMLTRYGRLGASSRLRSLQYIPYFVSQGLEITCRPLFSDAYVSNLYTQKPNFSEVLFAYMKRILDMRLAWRHDVLMVEKELFPWLPTFFELLFVPKRVKLVLDYDDAVFHRYDEHKSLFVRKILGRKIDELMKRADLVLAGNEYLAQRARSAGCKCVEIVPTVIDLDRYPYLKCKSQVSAPAIGWIGSPSTADYLALVAEVSTRIVERNDVRFFAIGARPGQLAGTPFQAMVWTEETEVASLHSLDVGIMPLRDEPWERGKCGYKLIQYMACGLPVIASPVGVNAQIVEHGVNGFVCGSGAEWQRAIEILVNDPGRRESMGLQGRSLVERHYCLQVQAPRIVSLLKKINGER